MKTKTILKVLIKLLHKKKLLNDDEYNNLNKSFIMDNKKNIDDMLESEVENKDSTGTAYLTVSKLLKTPTKYFIHINIFDTKLAVNKSNCETNIYEYGFSSEQEAIKFGKAVAHLHSLVKYALYNRYLVTFMVFAYPDSRGDREALRRLYGYNVALESLNFDEIIKEVKKCNVDHFKEFIDPYLYNFQFNPKRFNKQDLIESIYSNEMKKYIEERKKCILGGQ